MFIRGAGWPAPMEGEAFGSSGVPEGSGSIRLFYGIWGRISNESTVKKMEAWKVPQGKIWDVKT